MKRYEVRGMMEWHPVFSAGRTRLKVTFTGGHLSAGGCTPASFETSDPVVQRVIESSLPFRRGQIRVMGGAAVGMTAPNDQRTDCAYGAAVSMTAAHGQPMEFSTLGEAQDFLQASKSVPIDGMLTHEDCIAVAARLGIPMTIKNT